MNISPRTTAVVAACLAATALCAPVMAQVIDFEDIGQMNGVVDLQGNSPYAGLNWNGTLDVIDLSTTTNFWSGTGPAFSGRYAVLNNSGGSGVISSVGDLFTFGGVEVKSWFNSGDGQPGSIVGSLNGSEVFS